MIIQNLIGLSESSVFFNPDIEVAAHKLTFTWAWVFQPNIYVRLWKSSTGSQWFQGMQVSWAKPSQEEEDSTWHKISLLGNSQNVSVMPQGAQTPHSFCSLEANWIKGKKTQSRSCSCASQCWDKFPRRVLSSLHLVIPSWLRSDSSQHLTDVSRQPGNIYLFSQKMTEGSLSSLKILGLRSSWGLFNLPLIRFYWMSSPISLWDWAQSNNVWNSNLGFNMGRMKGW